jgi:predicted porin
MTQIGSYSVGNNAKYAYELTAGFDVFGFSFDGVYEHATDAVALSTLGANPISPTLLKATIENEDSFQVAGKYKWDRFTFYAGYEYQRLSNPTDLPATATISSFNGVDAIYGATGGGTQGVAFPVPKQVNLFWTGAKFAVLSNVDLIGAYYYVHQNDYRGGTATPAGAGSCLPNTTAIAGAAAAGFTPQGTANSKCAGNEYPVSGVVDWRPLKRFDVYAGAMYTKVGGGLANGYFVNNNLAATGGVRLSF